MSEDPDAAARARFAALDAALDGLRAQYDLLMNGFKFDAAKAVAARIDAAERERAALAATLPAPPAEPPPAPFRVMRRRRR
jgi:hypothetical protein